jgi:hypothetical protein
MAYRGDHSQVDRWYRWPCRSSHTSGFGGGHRTVNDAKLRQGQFTSFHEVQNARALNGGAFSTGDNVRPCKVGERNRGPYIFNGLSGAGSSH